MNACLDLRTHLGVFDHGGAPRWKQRALYDPIKDAVAVSGSGPRLSRLAVFDVVDGVELGAALEGQEVLDPTALLQLVEKRIAPL